METHGFPLNPWRVSGLVKLVSSTDTSTVHAAVVICSVKRVTRFTRAAPAGWKIPCCHGHLKPRLGFEWPSHCVVPVGSWYDELKDNHNQATYGAHHCLANPEKSCEDTSK